MNYMKKATGINFTKFFILVICWGTLQACNTENQTQESEVVEETTTREEAPNADTAVFTGPAATGNTYDIPANDKACNLLSKDEVKQALSLPDSVFTSQDTTVNQYGNMCSYSWKRPKEDFRNVVSIFVPQANSTLATETAFREDLSKASKTSKKINNLGDEAYWLKELNQLYVIKNGRWFYVYMALGKNQTEQQALSKAQALAEKLVAKL